MIVCIETEKLKKKKTELNTEYDKGWNDALDAVAKTSIPLKSVIPDIIGAIRGKNGKER